MEGKTMPEQAERSVAAASDAASPNSRWRWTLPNVLSATRLAGAPVLVVLALFGWTHGFIGWFLFLAMTDWLDGKLAILLRQRTVFGARLDSWADATYYGSLLLGVVLLRGEVLLGQWPWIAAALASYILTTGMGLWKFGRWPSYHTRAAKTSWLLTTIGALCLLLDWSVWPLRVAMVAVVLTNIEATLITRALPRWQANVTSLYHAISARDAEGSHVE